MNTVEVAIEQLLAGALALLVFFLPITDIVPLSIFGNSAVAIGFLGTAYVLGVVVDKTVDKILGGLEKFHLHRLVHGESDERLPGFKPDEAEVTLRVHGGETVERWMGYLRTRIRISRMVGVLIPLMTLSIAATLWTRHACGVDSVIGLGQWLAGRRACLGRAHGIPLSPLAAYALTFVICFIPGLKIQRVEKAKYGKPDSPTWLGNRARALVPTSVLYLLCLLGSACLLLLCNSEASLLPIVIGPPLLLGLGALWSWWAVQKTYQTFLSKAAEIHKRDTRPKAAAPAQAPQP